MFYFTIHDMTVSCSTHNNHDEVMLSIQQMSTLSVNMMKYRDAVSVSIVGHYCCARITVKIQESLILKLNAIVSRLKQVYFY